MHGPMYVKCKYSYYIKQNTPRLYYQDQSANWALEQECLMFHSENTTKAVSTHFRAKFRILNVCYYINVCFKCLIFLYC